MPPRPRNQFAELESSNADYSNVNDTRLNELAQVEGVVSARSACYFTRNYARASRTFEVLRTDLYDGGILHVRG